MVPVYHLEGAHLVDVREPEHVEVLVDSPELTEYLRELALQGMAPAISYQAKLENGRVVWVTEDNGKMHTLYKEPGDWWRRLNAWFSSAVGLERML